LADKTAKEPEPKELISGTLNILGIKLDLGELLGSAEELQGRLEELRERLQAAGGKAAGPVTISGHIQTRGLLGEREFHIGTAGRPEAQARGRRAAAPTRPEEVEPTVDVFEEGDEVVVVADVPGAGADDVECTVRGDTLLLSSQAGARRRYKKEVHLPAPVDSEGMRVTCRNGVLEARLKKRGEKSS
jgi:HSP20 family protein